MAEYSALVRVEPVFPLDYVLRTEELIHLQDPAALPWTCGPISALSELGRCRLEAMRPLDELIRRLNDHLAALGVQTLPEAFTAAREREEDADSLAGLSNALAKALRELIEKPGLLCLHTMDCAREATRIIESSIR